MTAHDPALVERVAIAICETSQDRMAWDDVSDHWHGIYREKAIVVLDTIGLAAETKTIPVFVDDDPPALVWRGLEQVPARHTEFIPHTRLRTDWHGDECPECAAEPGVHDRRHAEYLAEMAERADQHRSGDVMELGR